MGVPLLADVNTDSTMLQLTGVSLIWRKVFFVLTGS